MAGTGWQTPSKRRAPALDDSSQRHWWAFSPPYHPPGGAGAQRTAVPQLSPVRADTHEVRGATTSFRDAGAAADVPHRARRSLSFSVMHEQPPAGFPPGQIDDSLPGVRRPHSATGLADRSLADSAAGGGAAATVLGQRPPSSSQQQQQQQFSSREQEANAYSQRVGEARAALQDLETLYNEYMAAYTSLRSEQGRVDATHADVLAQLEARRAQLQQQIDVHFSAGIHNLEILRRMRTARFDTDLSVLQHNLDEVHAVVQALQASLLCDSRHDFLHRYQQLRGEVDRVVRLVPPKPPSEGLQWAAHFEFQDIELVPKQSAPASAHVTMAAPQPQYHTARSPMVSGLQSGDTAAIPRPRRHSLQPSKSTRKLVLPSGYAAEMREATQRYRTVSDPHRDHVPPMRRRRASVSGGTPRRAVLPDLPLQSPTSASPPFSSLPVQQRPRTVSGGSNTSIQELGRLLSIDLGPDAGDDEAAAAAADDDDDTV